MYYVAYIECKYFVKKLNKILDELIDSKNQLT